MEESGRGDSSALTTSHRRTCTWELDREFKSRVEFSKFGSPRATLQEIEIGVRDKRSISHWFENHLGKIGNAERRPDDGRSFSI
jgi:hypothetical protein